MLRLFVLLAASGIAGCQKNSGRLDSKKVDELSRVVEQGKSDEKAAAALELSKRGTAASSSVPTLIDALKSDDPALRQNAALALGKIGPAASAAVDALIEVLSDSEWTVRRSAVMALGEIGDPRGLEPVLQRLRDSDSLVRKAADQSVNRLKEKMKTP